MDEMGNEMGRGVGLCSGRVLGRRESVGRLGECIHVRPSACPALDIRREAINIDSLRSTHPRIRHRGKQG